MALDVALALDEETLENGLAELVALGAEPGFIYRDVINRVLPDLTQIPGDIVEWFRERLTEEEIELRDRKSVV